MANRMSAAAQRVSQLRLAFNQTRQVDPRLVPLLAGAALVGFGLCLLVGVLTGYPLWGGLFGLLVAALACLFVFGQRTSKAALGAIEGQPGAAAAVLQSMRGTWRVTPAVAFTRKQDFVHRAVGRPGVVVVGEGSRARVTELLRQERRRIGRVVGDTPVHEVHIGDGDGQVPLRSLSNHLARLPRALKGPAIDALDNRLKSLGGTNVPLPKGPMPRSRRRV